MEVLTERTKRNITEGTNLIAQGFKHLQFRQGGCIKRVKNKEGHHYVIKQGLGTGAVCNKFNTLKEAIIYLQGYGWGEIVSYK